MFFLLKKKNFIGTGGSREVKLVQRRTGLKGWMSFETLTALSMVACKAEIEERITGIEEVGL